MNEVYTCECGYQDWTICDGFIICNDCGDQYSFKRLGNSPFYIFENPKDFNKKAKN